MSAPPEYPGPARPDYKGPSQEEVRHEASKAAQKSLELKREAERLKKAAKGAADPDERQKLLEKALDKECEAEAFGKTAKYMRKGTFQGMAVGAGFGVAPGATLGTITGTLVGGVTSTLLGGIGAGIGSLVGWVHGPFWNMGEQMGKGVKKITGNIPGWKATDEQKRTLEKMIGQINEEDTPSEADLQQLAEDDAKARDWGDWAASFTPGPNKDTGKSDETGQNNESRQSQSKETGQKKSRGDEWHSKSAAEREKQPERVDPETVEALRRTMNENKAQGGQPKTQTRNSSQKQQGSVEKPQERPGSQARKPPRKLEVRSEKPQKAAQTTPGEQKKPPRKLEVRSRQAA